MRFLLTLAVVAATCTGWAQGTLEAILGYANSSGAVVGATAGWTFQTTNIVITTELGCFNKVFNDNPAVTNIQVGLWDQGGVLLASNSITLSSTVFDQSRYVPISEVELDPGQTYHIGIYSGGILSLGIAGAAAGGGLSNSVPLQVRGAALAAGAGFTFPAEEPGSDGSIYVGPNFQFRNVGGTPEPTSSLLLGLGALLFAARRGKWQF